MIGELSALLTAALWSATSLVFTAAVLRIGSVQVNVTRLLIALFYLSVTTFLLGIDFSISTSQFVNLSLSGIAGLVIGDSFLFKAYGAVGPRISMLIMSFAPAVGAALAYVFLGETLSPWGITGMAVTLGGIVLVVMERPAAGEPDHPLKRQGILLAFGAALGQGVGLIFAKQAFLESDLHALAATLVRIASSVAILLPTAIAMRRYRNPFAVFAADPRALGFTAVGAFIGPFLGITFSLVAVANTKVGIAATLMATVPILMLPMIRFVQKERLSWKAVAGAFIAVAGVAILFLR